MNHVICWFAVYVVLSIGLVYLYRYNSAYFNGIALKFKLFFKLAIFGGDSFTKEERATWEAMLNASRRRDRKGDANAFASAPQLTGSLSTLEEPGLELTFFTLPTLDRKLQFILEQSGTCAMSLRGDGKVSFLVPNGHLDCVVSDLRAVSFGQSGDPRSISVKRLILKPRSSRNRLDTRRHSAFAKSDKDTVGQYFLIGKLPLQDRMKLTDRFVRHIDLLDGRILVESRHIDICLNALNAEVQSESHESRIEVKELSVWKLI
jgi:hypothetical protein